jgi:hypothetical protein
LGVPLVCSKSPQPSEKKTRLYIILAKSTRLPS